MDDCVAIIVPDDQFDNGFKPALAAKLAEAFDADAFTLISAVESAAQLTTPGPVKPARVVLSSISMFEGLERLIVALILS